MGVKSPKWLVYLSGEFQVWRCLGNIQEKSFWVDLHFVILGACSSTWQAYIFCDTMSCQAHSVTPCYVCHTCHFLHNRIPRCQIISMKLFLHLRLWLCVNENVKPTDILWTAPNTCLIRYYTFSFVKSLDYRDYDDMDGFLVLWVMWLL